MTLHDFLLKYGTRSASMVLRKSKDPFVKEIADNLQAALEDYVTNEDIKPLTMREVMSRGGGNGHDKS